MRIASAALIVLSICTLHCKKDPKITSIRNLSGGQIGVFGHGGMGIKSLLPVDSKESLLQALDMGADGTEMDLQLSSDSVLFLFHAEDLNLGTHCTGQIRQLAAASIDCRYKSLSPGSQLVCRLEDFLFVVKDTTAILTFECKSYNLEAKDYPVFARALSKLIQKYHLQKRVFVESISSDLLLFIRQLEPQLKLFLYSEEIQETLVLADKFDFFGVTFDMNRISEKQVEEAHSRNLRVTLFNQQSTQDNQRALKLNPDFIQTDHLQNLLELTGKK